MVWLGLQFVLPTIYLVAMQVKPVEGEAVRPELGPGVLMALSAGSNALTLIMVPIILVATSGARRRDFGLESRSLAENVFRGLIAYPLIVPIVYGALFLALAIWNRTPHTLEDALKLGQNPLMLMVQVLAAVVFAPLAEELIFRGVLLGWLTRPAIASRKPEAVEPLLLDESENRSFDTTFSTEPGFAHGLDLDPFNPYSAPLAKLEVAVADEESPARTSLARLLLANGFVSLIFAGLHAAAWPSPVPIFFLSLALGLLYQRTGSLIPSMVLHMTFNGVSTLLLILSLDAMPPKKDAKPAEAPKVQARAAAMVDFNFFPNRVH